MPLLKKVSPWPSLGILMATYSAFGWYITNFVNHLKPAPEDLDPVFSILGWTIPVSTLPWLIWSSAITGTLLLAATLTSPLANMRALIARSSQSETRAFISMLMAAVGLVFVLTWIHITAHVLVIVAAAILARLDIDQGADLTKLQDFLILGGVSVTGLGMGWIGCQLF
ncbi:hypothetical protein [Neosynechococcus sphagnicola]|uniref:hypothetical protein n=1 Tax=Neosynechococcus sphagnicola TaxID=1501145 RepID=UPI0012E08842|nr:hypothetical protein [Neosynechococcus sphagnicola]